MKYDPIKSLNDEVERKLLMPLIIGIVLVLLLVPFMIAIILNFKDQIDAFSMRHPIILALCFIVPGVIGWYYFGKRNRLW